MQEAIFAAGCFWGVQFYFDRIPGVVETEVGYIGGNVANPSYEDVCYKDTGHAEAVKVKFDASKLNYEKLLQHFFRLHDPTQLNRQGPDVGTQYRSAIFALDSRQAQEAADFIENENNDREIVTTIEKAKQFWKAEEYHQKYTEKTGRGMCHIPYKSL